MSVLFFPGISVRNQYPSFEQSEPIYKTNSYKDWLPSECCGSQFIPHNYGENRGIIIWFSDKPEDEPPGDEYFIESVNLINGEYMHFKHCLLEENPEEEDEEW